jgi:hypothetical protein
LTELGYFWGLPFILLFLNHHFSSLDLELSRNIYQFSVVNAVKLDTKNDKKIRFSCKNESSNMLGDMITQTTYEKVTKSDRKQVVVVCGSVKSLYLCGRRAYF